MIIRSAGKMLGLEDDPDRKALMKKIIFLFPIISIILFIFLKIAFRDIYWEINTEYGLIENIQSLLYLISSILALFISINFFKKGLPLYGLLYGMLSCGLFFICMEEISWGQRILGIQVSDYLMTYNNEQEISIHNMDFARSYVNESYTLIGILCSFSWLMVPRKVKAIAPSMVKYFIPDKLLIFYFLPLLVIYLYISYISGILVHMTGINAFHIGNMSGPYVIDFIDQEPAEFLLVLGFLIFLIINRYRQAEEASYENKKSRRLAFTLFAGLLLISLPVHLIHSFLYERVYPYDRIGFGNAFKEQGMLNDAIEQYQEALKIDPIHAESHNNLGVALLESGKVEEALKHFAEAVRIRPFDIRALNNLGDALAKEGRLKEAVIHYAEVVRIKPELLSSHITIGNVLSQMGKAEEAFMHYTEAVRIDPGSFAAHYNLGKALLVMGRLDKAIMHLAESLRLKPDNDMAHNNLGNALARQGNYDEAILHYYESLRINPGVANVHSNLGIILKKQGRIQEAVEQFSEALHIDPGYEKARHQLNALQQQGLI